MVQEFPEELPGNARCLWNKNLYKHNDQLPTLSTKMKDEYHSFVAKGLLLSQSACPDTMRTIAFLSHRLTILQNMLGSNHVKQWIF